jgi:hypothetical protein
MLSGIHTIASKYLTIVVFTILAIQGLVLLWFGQPLICECGHVKIWEGVVQGSGNSQHVSDWYTFSHVLHGFIFYWVLVWLVPGISLRMRLVLALGIEVGWEMLENTPMVIDHYRQQALAQGYTGDSILNSLSDTAGMIGGFFFAWRCSWKITVAFALMLELFTIFMIRDGLVLNIINLLYPFEIVARWQSGGL